MSSGKLKLGRSHPRLSRLSEWDRNPRRISDSRMDNLKASMQAEPETLEARPLICTPDGTVLAGNMRLRAARELGLSSLPVFVIEADERRARAIALRDNNEFGEWVPDEVAQMIAQHEADGEDLATLGFAEGEVESFLASVEDEGAKPPPPEPAIVPPKNPTTNPGDLYTLGDHKLLCGDATDLEDVGQLIGRRRVECVLTDPPFAIYGSSSGLSSSVTDDKIVRPFFRDALVAASRAVKLFGSVYVHCDWRSWPSWWEVAKVTSLEPKNLLVWDKHGSGLGSNWANTHELIGYFVHMPEQKTMKGEGPKGIRPVLHTNVLRFPRPSGTERLHNAAKPVPLLAEIMDASTDEGAHVADLFLGSGSTLIACETSGRKCRALEVDPAWCDVAVERWQQLTGRKARRKRG